MFIGLGALLAIEPMVVGALGKLKIKQVFLMLWIGGLLIAFGAAFFVAAESSQAKIDEQSSIAFVLTRETAA